MIQGINKRYLEYFVVAIVIAVLILTALNYYILIAKDSAVLRLQIISQSFMTGAANARAAYFLRYTGKEASAQDVYKLGDKALYFSDQGWPVSTQPPSPLNHLTHQDCYEFWQIFLQNPEIISSPSKELDDAAIQVFAFQSACRYQLKTGDAWFEYYPWEGRLHFSSTSSSKF